jgi:group II intron reverse transcriptase/maturase
MSLHDASNPSSGSTMQGVTNAPEPDDRLFKRLLSRLRLQQALKWVKINHATPGVDDHLLKRILSRPNLEQAWKWVKDNDGTPGVDDLTVDQLPAFNFDKWPLICQMLLAGTYQPHPVKQVEIPKLAGDLKPLEIPTVLDRLIQQATIQVLSPIFNPDFSDHSYGFQSGRSAHDATRAVQQYIKEGFQYAVDMDLEDFYNTASHDFLIHRLARKVRDKRLLTLIGKYLRAGVMVKGRLQISNQGVAQGSPLSPLLANIMFDDLDKKLERRGHRFVRYADYLVILVKSQRAGEQVMVSVRRFLERKLGLKVNKAKCRVARTDQMGFLDLTFKGNKEESTATLQPESHRRRRIMKKISFAIATLLIALVGIGMLLNDQEGLAVKTIKASKGDITVTLSATGKIVSRQETQISASVAARVQAVEVQEGDRVAAGAVLVLLDDHELAVQVKVAEEAFREAAEKVRQMKRNVEALVVIYAAGGVSRQAVEDAKSDLEISRATENRAAAELKRSKLTLDKLKVKAPFAGIITRKDINQGEWVSPGTGIFSLAKEKSRRIEVNVDESDAGLVKAGQPVELTSDAFPGRAWVERVMEIAPAVQKEGGANSITVWVSYGVQAPNLKLGQQVDAKIRTAHLADIVKLPFECLTGKGGQTFVAMIADGTRADNNQRSPIFGFNHTRMTDDGDRDGMVRLVPVETGIEDAASVQIVKGISAGQEVIVLEGKPLEEGQRVRTAALESPRQ